MGAAARVQLLFATSHDGVFFLNIHSLFIINICLSKDNIKKTKQNNLETNLKIRLWSKGIKALPFDSSKKLVHVLKDTAC